MADPTPANSTRPVRPWPRTLRTIHICSLSGVTRELALALLQPVKRICPSAEIVAAPLGGRDDILYILICTSQHDFSAVKYYVFWQLENFDAEPGADNNDYNSRYRDCRAHLPLLSNALRIWDYAKRNIVILNDTLGLAAEHVPIGYSHAVRGPYARDYIESGKDIDVLFLGYPSEGRRAVIAEQLGGVCNFAAIWGVGLSKMQEWISRSRICVNIHFILPFNLQTVRLNVLLSNHACVVSESAQDADTQKLYESNGVIFAEPDQLISTIVALIPDQVRRKELADQSWSWYRCERRWERLVDFATLLPNQWADA